MSFHAGHVPRIAANNTPTNTIILIFANEIEIYPRFGLSSRIIPFPATGNVERERGGGSFCNLAGESEWKSGRLITMKAPRIHAYVSVAGKLTALYHVALFSPAKMLTFHIYCFCANKLGKQVKVGRTKCLHFWWQTTTQFLLHGSPNYKFKRDYENVWLRICFDNFIVTLGDYKFRRVNGRFLKSPINSQIYLAS